MKVTFEYTNNSIEYECKSVSEYDDVVYLTKKNGNYLVMSLRHKDLIGYYVEESEE